MHQTMFKRNSLTRSAIKIVGHIIYMYAFVAMLSTVLISCDNRIKYIDSYVIEKNGKYGLIDSLGNEILPPAYLQVRKNSNSGLAIVVLDTIISHNTEKRNTLSLLLQPHDTPHPPHPAACLLFQKNWRLGYLRDANINECAKLAYSKYIFQSTTFSPNLLCISILDESSRLPQP